MALRQIFKKLNRHKNELGYGLDSIVTIYKDSRFGWMWKEPVFDKWLPCSRRYIKKVLIQGYDTDV